MVKKRLVTKILVAIDGSEHASKALDFALEVAEQCDAEVQIFSVFPPVIIPSFPVRIPMLLQVEDNFKTILRNALEKAKEKKPMLKISTRLGKGYPADEIVKTAKEGSFDLIVVGSRGLGNIKEIVLGGVSDRVADKATCPVLIIK